MTNPMIDPIPATVEEAIARAHAYLKELERGAPWPVLAEDNPMTSAALADHFSQMVAGGIIRRVNDLARHQPDNHQLCEVERLTLLAAHLAGALVAERRRAMDLVNCTTPISFILNNKSGV